MNAFQRQRMSWLGGITDAMDRNLNKLREIVEDRGACWATVNGVTESQKKLSNLNSNSTRP